MKKVYANLLSGTIILIGAIAIGGILKMGKNHIDYTNSPLISVKNELEIKVDSLQGKRNYWIALKNSSVPVEVPADLANNFINDFNGQIKTLEDSISKIERNPEFKSLKKKAFLYE